MNLLLICGIISVASATSGALGPYNISSVTLSGLSSGAYFAVQLHVAYSSVFSGAAIYAGVTFISLFLHKIFILFFEIQINYNKICYN